MKHCSKLVALIGLIGSLSGSAICQAIEAKLSYSTSAKSVKNILAELSTKTGLQLSASGKVAREIVVINVHDVPLSAVLDRIAEVTTGNWINVQGARQLELNSAKAKEQERLELSERAQKIADSISKANKASVGPWTKDSVEKVMARAKEVGEKLKTNQDNQNQKLWEELGRIQTTSPSGRALNRLLALIDPITIAKIGTSDRVVYATSPTSVQRALPARAEAIVSDFLSDTNIWNPVLADAPKPQGDEDEPIYWNAATTDLSKPIAKVLLIFTRFGWGGGISVEFRVVNTEGTYIAQTNSQIEDGSEHDFFEPPEMPAINSSTTPIKLGPDSQMLVDSLGQTYAASDGGAEAPFKSISAALRSKLLHPEEYDPLSFVPSDLVMSLATATNPNLIFNLADSSIFSMVMAVQSPLNVKTVRKMCEGAMGLQIDEKDNWIVGKPKKPGLARAGRINRSSLGVYARNVDKYGSSLDGMATFMYENPNVSLESEASMILAMAVAQDPQETGWSESGLLRFYGSLSQDQRQALKSSKSIKIGNLGTEQQSLIATMVYSQNRGFSGPMEAQMSVAEPAVDTKEDNPYRDIDSEPTETLPNGIPTAGFVRLDLTQEQVAVAKGTFFGAMTPIDIGNQLAMKERVDLYPWMAEQPPFAKFILGNRTSYKFNFLFTPTVSDVRQLFDVQRPSKDELTLEQLPSDFRAAIEKAKEEMKKAMQDMKPGDMGNGGGNYKPPPYCFMP